MAQYQWATMHIPFGTGLVQNVDNRASSPPSLDVARDVMFDELQGVQDRFPFASAGNNILGGGTLSNCRRVVAYNNERLCFTDVALYSRDERDSAWVLRGTHLAVACDEETRFANTDDLAQSDRAELNNTVVYVLANTKAPSTIYIAAIDKTTGATICPPTVVTNAVGLPKLVALATKILLFYEDGLSQIVVVAVDPANVATSALAAGTALVTATGGTYDAVKIPGADTALFVGTQSPNTSYTVAKITAGISTSIVSKARTADSQIAVSADPTAAVVQVIRGNGTNVQGDKLVLSSLADSTVNQAVGTVAGGPINHIVAAHRSVQDGGQYRCYVFWDSQEPPTSAVFQSKSNWVDTGGTIGTQGNFVKLISPASRAFDYNGQVYFWGVFANPTTGAASGYYSQQFNAYFLYRDDGRLCAKATSGTAGGIRTGPLPGVQLISGSTGFAWMGSTRRVIPFGTNSTNLGYAMRAPQDITFTFDDNRARRCAQAGNTLYITGGEVMQYDGTQLTEVGFHVPPQNTAASIGGGTTVAAGTYAYKGTWRWPNGGGDLDRSTSGTTTSFTAGGGAGVSITDVPLFITHKTSTAIGYEIWRTAVAPQDDSPFFKVTSLDPTVANPNAYIANDTTATALAACNDQLTDAQLTTHEQNPEPAGVPIALAPPAASIIFAYGSRLFLSGIPNAPDLVMYSKQRADGFVAQFNGNLSFLVPPSGGSITAVAVLNETVIVFRQRAIYMMPGTGFDNAGGGNNYGPANQIAGDIGAVSMESVALTPMGIIFKSEKGWYLLNRGWQVTYIGGPVKDFDGDTVLSVNVIETRHEVRCLTNNRMIVLNYRGMVDSNDPDRGQWAEWTIGDGLHAVTWNGTYYYLNATGPLAEQTTYTNLTYGQDVETSWIKPAGLSGQAMVRWIMPLGEVRTTGWFLRVRVARNYEQDGAGNWSYFDDVLKIPATTIGGPLQVRLGPSVKQVESLKVRLTAVVEGVPAAISTTIGLSGTVSTSGTIWNATIARLPPFYGEAGNKLKLNIVFVAAAIGASFSIKVIDNRKYDLASAKWIAEDHTVGVLVTMSASSKPTVGQLEAAITAGSTLVAVAIPDVTPSKTVSTLMIGQQLTGSLVSGTYAAPTGEALKLTGLSLEHGVRGDLFKLLAQGQKA